LQAFCQSNMVPTKKKMHHLHVQQTDHTEIMCLEECTIKKRHPSGLK